MSAGDYFDIAFLGSWLIFLFIFPFPRARSLETWLLRANLVKYELSIIVNLRTTSSYLTHLS